jgi:hypothetical protein
VSASPTATPSASCDCEWGGQAKQGEPWQASWALDIGLTRVEFSLPPSPEASLHLLTRQVDGWLSWTRLALSGRVLQPVDPAHRFTQAGLRRGGGGLLSPDGYETSLFPSQRTSLIIRFVRLFLATKLLKRIALVSVRVSILRIELDGLLTGAQPFLVPT